MKRQRTAEEKHLAVISAQLNPLWPLIRIAGWIALVLIPIGILAHLTGY